MRIALATGCPLVLALALAACGGGSSGGGRGGAPGGGAARAASTVNRAQWQVALAALSSQGAYAPPPVAFDAAAFARWNELIARNWPAYRTLVDPAIEAELRAALAVLPSGGAVAVTAIRGVTVDTAAPPSLAGGGSAFMLSLPGAPGAWAISFTADIAATVTIATFGAPLTLHFAADVTASVSHIRIEQPVALDLSDPARPRFAGAGAPSLSLKIALSSSNALLSQVATALGAALDPVVRAALVAGAVAAEQAIGLSLAQVPQGPPWGAGAPPAAPVPGAPPLEPLAIRIADEIQRDHMPFDTVLPATFDQPGYGNGAPVAYFDHGDSAIWTGHYLAAEALRHEMTGDARALAGARRALAGLENCFDVPLPGDGLLARCAMPLASPHAAAIAGSPSFIIGFAAGGQPYAGLQDISRDQYTGAMLGLTQAWLRVPPLRARAGALIARAVSYLEAHGWVAYNRDGVTPAAPFAQSPAAVVSFLRSASLVDPPRFAAAHARAAEMTPVLWFASWTTAREVHHGYYKFNLGHAHIVDLVTTETDPARYRDYVKALEMNRDATGHHQNAWFDAVYGLAVPAAAPALGPRVKNALDRWALRDRRSHPVANSQDPAIAKALYTSPLLVKPEWFALEPIPIERRPSTDFLWQRSPFELDGGGDPRDQYPGVDLILPYWAARSYGMIP